MSMQTHVLAALRECRDEIDALLAGLTPAQIAAPVTPEGWTVSDVLAHLLFWQLRTRARVRAALHGGEPDLTSWLAGFTGDFEDVDAVNAWAYQQYRARPYHSVADEWRANFSGIIEDTAQIDEPALLAWERYPWLGDFPIVDVLIATYDHHAEHLLQLRDWLGQS